MTARITQLCSEIAAALNACETLSIPVAAVRAVAPIKTLPELLDRYVAVTPLEWTATPATLDGMEQHDMTVRVHVLQKVPAEDNATLDPLVDLVGEIADFLLEDHGSTTATCDEASVEILDDDVYEKRQFTAVIEAKYREVL